MICRSAPRPSCRRCCRRPCRRRCPRPPPQRADQPLPDVGGLAIVLFFVGFGAWAGLAAAGERRHRHGYRRCRRQRARRCSISKAASSGSLVHDGDGSRRARSCSASTTPRREPRSTGCSGQHWTARRPRGAAAGRGDGTPTISTSRPTSWPAAAIPGRHVADQPAADLRDAAAELCRPAQHPAEADRSAARPRSSASRRRSPPPTGRCS